MRLLSHLFFVFVVGFFTLKAISAQAYELSERDLITVANQHQQQAKFCTVIESVKSPKLFLDRKGKGDSFKGPDQARAIVLEQFETGLRLNPSTSTSQWYENVWRDRLKPMFRCDNHAYFADAMKILCEADPEMSGQVCDDLKLWETGIITRTEFFSKDEANERMSAQATSAWQLDAPVSPPYESEPTIFTKTTIGNQSLTLGITGSSTLMPWWEMGSDGLMKPPGAGEIPRWVGGVQRWVEPQITLQGPASSIWYSQTRSFKSLKIIAYVNNRDVVIASSEGNAYVPKPWGRKRGLARLGQTVRLNANVNNINKLRKAKSLSLVIEMRRGEPLKVKFSTFALAKNLETLVSYWNNRNKMYNQYLAQLKLEKDKQNEAAKQKRHERFLATIEPLTQRAIKTVSTWRNNAQETSECGRPPSMPDLDASKTTVRRLNRDVDDWMDCEHEYRKRLLKTWNNGVVDKLNTMEYEGTVGGLRADSAKKTYKSAQSYLNQLLDQSHGRVRDLNARINRHNRSIDRYDRENARRSENYDVWQEAFRSAAESMERNYQRNQQMYNMYYQPMYITPRYN